MSQPYFMVNLIQLSSPSQSFIKPVRYTVRMSRAVPHRGAALSTHSHSNHLSDKHQVTVVIRLVLDRHGKLMHGELVDVKTKSQGRFANWTGLVRTLREWLASQSLSDTSRPA